MKFVTDQFFYLVFDFRNFEDVSDSVVMQIKILMDIPEYIWSAIDSRDLLMAAQLYILAQHVNYSLTFEVGHSVLSHKYPIVAKQWSVIGHFKNVIFNECNDTLRSLDLSREVEKTYCFSCYQISYGDFNLFDF